MVDSLSETKFVSDGGDLLPVFVGDGFAATAFVFVVEVNEATTGGFELWIGEDRVVDEFAISGEITDAVGRVLDDHDKFGFADAVAPPSAQHEEEHDNDYENQNDDRRSACWSHEKKVTSCRGLRN